MTRIYPTMRVAAGPVGITYPEARLNGKDTSSDVLNDLSYPDGPCEAKFSG